MLVSNVGAEMKTSLTQWNVVVNGLGGPRADFNRKTFHVNANSPYEAIEKSINAFQEMDKSEGERWTLDYGGGWVPYDFYSATVTRTEEVLLIDEGGC